MNRTWAHRLWIGLRVALGGGLLVLAFRQIDWAQIGPTLSEANPLWLLLGLLSVLLSLGLRIWRWQCLLANYAIDVDWRHIVGAYLIGQSANIVMPVRTGEIFRFGWLRTRYLKGAAPMVATIAIEKYLDLGLLLLFFIGVMPYLPLSVIESNLTSMLAGSALLTLIIVAGAFSGPRAGLWLGRFLQNIGQPGGVVQRWFSPAAPALQSLAHWLASNAWMQSPRRFLPALGLSLAAWLVMALTNLLVMRAVGLAWDPRAAVLVLVLVYVGSVPALVPGNIGPFHFFAMLGLSLLGIQGLQSAAFALFLHALVTLPPLLISAGLLLVDLKIPARHAVQRADRNR